MVSQEYQHEEDQEENQESLIKKITNDYLKPLEGVGDEEELNLYETSHNSGSQTTHKFKVGEWKKQIKDGIDNLSKGADALFVHWDSGNGVDLMYHDFYGIEVVTPEIRAAEEKTAEVEQDIGALGKLGVKREVFYDYDAFGGEGLKCTPEEIVQYGKIIETYLNSKDKN